MAKTSKVKILEHCIVSPLPHNAAASPTSLPLTFLDIPWLFFSPSQPLFFYQYPHSTSHFISTTVPNLKRSLSLTLQHFFPFAGNLVFLSNKPHIVYMEGDHVSFTVAECGADFSHFTCNHARDVNDFYPLVPELTTTVQVETQLLPLLAVQVTVFPNRGICLGLAYHHVVADGRTFNNFIKTWASFCTNYSFSKINNLLPFYDRTVIKDSHGLEEKLLKEFWKRKSTKEITLGTDETNIDLSSMVRATFVMSLTDMERIKKWIIGQCKKKNQAEPIHLSPYVLTCAFVWVCLAKTQIQSQNEDDKRYPVSDPNYLGFIAGGITRLEFGVPNNYLGNCVGFGRCTTTRKELVEEDGIIVAAKAIGNMIKQLDKEIFGGAETWISEWEALHEFGEGGHIMVKGSPKVDVYKTDFGWGRAEKIEEISIDRMRGISLHESRDMTGGIEVGLALPKCQMEDFRSIFIQGLPQ